MHPKYIYRIHVLFSMSTPVHISKSVVGQKHYASPPQRDGSPKPTFPQTACQTGTLDLHQPAYRSIDGDVTLNLYQ